MDTAVITGANRGIGLELARQLRDRGYHIVAVCRESSPALNALDVQVESGIDVADREGLQTLADRLRGHRVELLVNNAGLMRRTSLSGIEDEIEDWRAQYEVNALSPLRVTRALSNHLVDGGKVVIITSRMGSIADNSSGGNWGYRMSKAAANMAGVTLAQEFKEREIAVGLLHPGFVRTDMTGGQGQVDAREAAAGLVDRISELGMRNTGSFLHANGAVDSKAASGLPEALLLGQQAQPRRVSKAGQVAGFNGRDDAAAGLGAVSAVTEAAAGRVRREFRKAALEGFGVHFP